MTVESCFLVEPLCLSSQVLQVFLWRMSSVDMGKTGDLTGSAPKMALTVATLYELICKILCHHGTSWPFSWGSCIRFDRLEILPEAIVRGNSSSRRCSSRRNATGGQCDVQSFGVTPAGWGLYNQFVSISSFDCYPSRKGDAKSSLKRWVCNIEPTKRIYYFSGW